MNDSQINKAISADRLTELANTALAAKADLMELAVQERQVELNTIRQHPAFRAIAEIAAALTEITEARRNLALLELKTRKQIPICLNAYFDAAGSDADLRIDLGDGQELVIDEEWWESSNQVSTVRLNKAPRTLEAIARAAMLATTTQPD